MDEVTAYPLGLAAALFLGLGYVMQQRAAARSTGDDLLSMRLVRFLLVQQDWWIGSIATLAGTVLGSLALDAAPVSTVEPLLSASLLFALVIANLLSHHRVRWTEIGGAALVTAALSIFLAVGQPQAAKNLRGDPTSVALAVGAVAAVSVLLVLAGRGRSMVRESIVLATAAGVITGLQDVATRALFVDADRHGWFIALLAEPWGYLLTITGIVSLVVSQSAFKAARLDYSLPPQTVAEPLVGILLGVFLLGDRLSVTVLGGVVEALCLVGMLAGVVLIGRSPSLAEPSRPPRVATPTPVGSTDLR